jgi:hypothetical protein
MIDYLVGIAGGLVIGWYAREWYAIRKIEKYMTTLNDNIIEELKGKVIDITIEDQNGVIFVYKREDGSYLAHGNSMEILEDILIAKFPGMLFNAKPEDLQKLKT